MNQEFATYLPNNASFSTQAIHIGSEPEKWAHSQLMPPISLSTTYQQELPPKQQAYHYTRSENPTRESLEECLAKLEETKHCLVFSSGMAAASLVTKLLRKGDHIITQTDLYHGIFNMFKALDSETDEIDVSFVDASDEMNMEKALRSNTRLVWLETPTNPLMKLIDLKRTTALIKARMPEALVACDNTFLSPYFQRPATLGVDLVMHSCTKYIGGHSDVLMGALCTNREDVYLELHRKRILFGPIPSPFECYLAIRSLRTLELRMQKHMTNSLQIAKFLERHPAIEKVFHPGLPSHPQHQLSLRQCYGHSGIFSFYVRGHNVEITRGILRNLRLIKLADSLGGTDTTIKMPSQMPPNSLSKEEMAVQGITDGLIRLSVGLENAQDLIHDLDQALTSLTLSEHWLVLGK